MCSPWKSGGDTPGRSLLCNVCHCCNAYFHWCVLTHQWYALYGEVFPMNGLLIMIIAIVVLLAAYLIYGRYLA